MAQFYDDAPQVLKEFLVYMESILGRSPKTVSEYYLDLRTFLRYMARKARFTSFLLGCYEGE